MAEKRIVVTTHREGAATAWLVLFMVWGVGGGLLSFVYLANANASRALGVGTSAAVSMNVLFWIGGLLFFGIPYIATRPRFIVRLVEDGK